jgi:hypothetical protein
MRVSGIVGTSYHRRRITLRLLSAFATLKGGDFCNQGRAFHIQAQRASAAPWGALRASALHVLRADARFRPRVSRPARRVPQPAEFDQPPPHRGRHRLARQHVQCACAGGGMVRRREHHRRNDVVRPVTSCWGADPGQGCAREAIYGACRSASVAASSIAAIRLVGLAMPLPAISYAVP